MKRYELILTLQGLEENKNKFEKLLSDVEDYYFKSAEVSATLETNQHEYKRKYDGSGITVNNGLFKEYLKSEIITHENKIQKIIVELGEKK
jgi:hypothetical protein